MERTGRQPREETSREVAEVARLRGDPASLGHFWDARYVDTYERVLEGRAEIGRHGVISEYLDRGLGGGVVLDAGCGTGILAELIDPGRFRYLGVDVSSRAIGLARRRRARPGAEFAVAPLEGYVPSVPIDGLVFNEVLYYLDAEAVLARFGPYLAERHLVVASVFDFVEGRELLRFLRARLARSSSTVVENPDEDLRWTIVAGVLDGGAGREAEAVVTVPSPDR